jgi:uncharacterized protein
MNKDEYDDYNNCRNTEITDELKRLGIYVEKTIDETNKFIEKAKCAKQDSQLLYLRIYTTTACNARCVYCYEKNVEVSEMSFATADKVVGFIESKYTGQREICIEWFGGEPLLNINIMDYISLRVKEFSERMGCKYWARIVSNGSKLDSVSEEKYKAWNISHIQVTIDGTKSLYEQVKNYKDGTTFEKVINNLLYIQKLGIKITIRINYSNDSILDCISLIRYLDNIFIDKKKIRVSWKRIMYSDSDNSLKFTYETDKLLFDECLKCGFIKNVERTINTRYIGCVAVNHSAYMIMPSGSVGKCSQAMADKDYLGNINVGFELESADKWKDYELDEKCVVCNMLPLCNGGCLYERMKGKECCMISGKMVEQKLIEILKRKMALT